ncbi:arginyl-tRNA synthetase [Gonapodya prolifera JEL478]|uniref:arginine--tRNA ligase n=1 Tax=Gonapodya prolifera (strain JEL478) TaxID=1344416 RepID=A0A139A3Z2_GONPJ|nr:arginyl-tRNA synthetase [Gonapodya prolifera JEL478]|eukprot:KXS11511.1 arginyl-tRNA synthetase [Gonapodya prolifera JEL478]
MVTVDFDPAIPPYAEVVAILASAPSSGVSTTVNLRPVPSGHSSVTVTSTTTNQSVPVRGKIHVARYFSRTVGLSYDEHSLAEQAAVDEFVDLCRKKPLNTKELVQQLEKTLKGQFLFGAKSPSLADFVAWDLVKVSKTPLTKGTSAAAWFSSIDESDLAKKASILVEEALSASKSLSTIANGANRVSKPSKDTMLPSTAPNFLPSLRTILLRSFQNAITNSRFTLTPSDPQLQAIIAESAQAGIHYQCNNAMSLFGKLKAAKALPNGVKSRGDVATTVLSNLDTSDFQGGETTFEVPAIAGTGFINIRVTSHVLAQRVHQMMREGVSVLAPSKYYGKRVVIDFSSPNVAKEMHVGHLRSTIIGDTLARTLEFCGVDLVRLNHIGDWGTQFGMLIEYMSDVAKSGSAEGLDPDSERVADLQVMYRAAKKRFDDDEDFKTRARVAVTKLQGGDPDSIRRWQRICDASRREFQAIYDRLGVQLVERGESFYNPMLAGVVEELQKLGVAKESDGAMCVFVEGREDPLIIRKSDGGYGYGTTDMAALKHRLNVEKAEWIIYVTDVGQASHFDLVFAAGRKAKWLPQDETQSPRVSHVGFGLVLGEDGKKFKTRSGDVVRLVELLDEAKDRCAATIQEYRGATVQTEDQPAPETTGASVSFTPAELDHAAGAMGYGAVKYADLKNSRLSNYRFSFDSMLSLKGDTAVYLLYAHARIASIFRKTDRDVPALAKVTVPILAHPREFELALHLCRFTEAIENLLEDLMPNRLTSYLYDLSEKFNLFYQDCRVIGSGEYEESRLVLCEATAVVMRKCFHLLGITELYKI